MFLHQTYKRIWIFSISLFENKLIVLRHGKLKLKFFENPDQQQTKFNSCRGTKRRLIYAKMKILKITFTCYSVSQF